SSDSYSTHFRCTSDSRSCNSSIFTLIPYTTLFRSRYWPSEVAVRCLVRRCHPRQPYGVRRSAWVMDIGEPSALGPSALKLILIRSEEHTSELQSRFDLVCRLLLEK